MARSGGVMSDLTKTAGGLSGQCFNCGAPTAGFWAGSYGSVEVCHGCAVGVLPKVIADAAGPVTTDGAKAAWLEAGAAFWRAVAAGALAKARTAAGVVNRLPPG